MSLTTQSLISSSDITNLTGIFAQHFDIFSRNITINKEPTKSFITQNINSLAGYGNNSIQQNIILTPVSGVYPALVLDSLAQDEQILPETRNKIAKGLTVIKVQSDARDYIKNGKTENIIVDGRVFNLTTDESVQNYLGLLYYYFELERTN